MQAENEASNLLRPHQVDDFESSRESLELKLSGPFSKYVEDKAAVRGQIRRLNHCLETQRPREVPEAEKDKFVKETDQLLSDILVGMPSQAEMRRCPPGAIGKHQAWERRNKEKIKRWKNNRLRLFVGSKDVDIANLEQYRPTKNTLNLENALIEGSDISLPPQVGHCSPYTDEEIRLIKRRAPEEVWSKLPILTAEQRTVVRQMYIETWEEPAVATAENLNGSEEYDDEESESFEANKVEEIQVLEEPQEAISHNMSEENESLDVTDSLTDVASIWGEPEKTKQPPAKQSKSSRRNRR